MGFCRLQMCPSKIDAVSSSFCALTTDKNLFTLDYNIELPANIKDYVKLLL